MRNISKDYLSSLIAGETVYVDIKGSDRYKRILGVVYLDDLNVNAEMIRAGLAWNYKYSKDKYYIRLQEKAKAERKVLWVDENPIDPWEWRKKKAQPKD